MSTEAEVGITQYANNLPGFTGILKHRYTDFKVNEVDPEGNVVHLTSLDPPQVDAQQAQQRQEPSTVAEEDVATPAAGDVEEVLASFAGLAGNSQLAAVREFLEQALSWHAAVKEGGVGERGSRPKAPPPLVLDPIADKDTRKAVHQLFKSLEGFPPMDTTTVVQPVSQQQPPGSSTENGTAADPVEGRAAAAAAVAKEAAGAPLQCIQVRVVKSAGRGKKRKWQQQQGGGWAGGSQDFVRFVLYKENTDSQVALSTLCRLLRVNHKVFGVAGTKDKRGVTAQAASAYRLDPGRLAGLNSRLRGMRVGNFAFADRGLWLGDLSGNRFEIILRNVEAESPALVEAAAEGLRRSGFINYFGLQRFGSGAVPTHRIGRALLRGEWAEAVKLLFTPREDSRSEVLAACRAFLEEGDVGKALQGMPRHLVAECAVLQGLKQYGPTQQLQALRLIPRNLRTMYLHAYQSLLWNSAASHRVTTYSIDRPVAGDLVLLPKDGSGKTGAGAAAGEGSGAAAGRTSHCSPVAAGSPSGAAAAAEEGADGEGDGEGVEAAPGEREGLSVHVVTEEEAAAGTFRMDDVVLPLPGWQIQYPQHATAQVYTELAAHDGVSLSEAPHGTREFQMIELPGAYRRVIHRPADLEYELLRYDDPDQELAATDLMVLEGKQLPQAPPAQDGAEGRYLALRLAFQLPTSCYATMLIRELTKMPTTTAFHKALQHQPAAS